MSDYVSIAEAAVLCNCSRGFILANIRRGVLTGKEAAGTFVLATDDVETFKKDVVHVHTGTRVVTKFTGHVPESAPKSVWGKGAPGVVLSRSRPRPAPPLADFVLGAPKAAKPRKPKPTPAPPMDAPPMTVEEVISKRPIPEDI